MSKTKLAILVFCIAFGLNGAAFLFSKKSFLVEEVKNVWMYELPLSASPLDSGVSLDLGPHQGVIGTLFIPNTLSAASAKPIENLLAQSWKWDEKTHSLEVQLKPNLHYSNGEVLSAKDWVDSHEWILRSLPSFQSTPGFGAWQKSHYSEIAGGIKITLSEVDADFDLEHFLANVLTHPMTGVFHPKNRATIDQGKVLAKEWISSGPYTIWKWNPKEITMVSRDDFPGGMRKGFFRTLKFQSAPVKNPSCDFMQGRAGDEKSLNEHTSQDSEALVHVFWACRSWNTKSTFCANPENRKKLSQILSGKQNEGAALSLAGQTLRYRIAFGSDEFRSRIREQLIEKVGTQAGAKIEETSFFFKNSDATDLELLFANTPEGQNSLDFATSLTQLSSRMGPGAIREADVVGELMSFPMKIYMKNRRGPVYQSVFLEADLEEKKLPL